MPIWRRRWFLQLMLAIIVLAVFLPVAGNQFVDWDDWYALAQNPDFQPVNWGRIAHYWSHGAFGLYAPLSYSVWAVLAWIEQRCTHSTDVSPALFHMANLTLHLFSAELVFLILGEFIEEMWPAFMGALLFALHPLQVEPVAWAISFNTLLSSMLGLAALWMYLHYANREQGPGLRSGPKTAISPGVVSGRGRPGSSSNRRSLVFGQLLNGNTGKGRRRGWFAGSCLMLILALCAKAQAVPVVLIAVVIEVFLLRRSVREFWIPILIWLAITVPFIAIGRWTQPAFSGASISFWARPLIVADTCAFYLGKLVWPGHLAIDYQRTPGWVISSGRIWLTWIVPVGVGLGAWMYKFRSQKPEASSQKGFNSQIPASSFRDRSASLIWAGLAIMFVAILPTSGIVGFQFQRYSTVGDRYMYLGMLGAVLAFAGLLCLVCRRGWMIAILVLLCFAVRTRARLRDWHDTFTLTAAAVDPGDPCALDHRIRGFALGRIGDNAASIEQYELAIQYDAADGTTFYDFGNVLMRSGDPAKAIVQYKRAITLDPENAQFHHNYAVALMAVRESARAGVEFYKAVELDPQSQQARDDYAKWLRIRK